VDGLIVIFSTVLLCGLIYHVAGWIIISTIVVVGRINIPTVVVIGRVNIPMVVVIGRINIPTVLSLVGLTYPRRCHWAEITYGFQPYEDIADRCTKNKNITQTHRAESPNLIQPNGNALGNPPRQQHPK